MRASVVRAAGGYREAFATAEDYDLWLRLLPDHRFAKLPVRLYRSRLDSPRSSPLRAHERNDSVAAIDDGDVRIATDVAALGAHAARFESDIAAGRVVGEGNLFLSARHQ